MITCNYPTLSTKAKKKNKKKSKSTRYIVCAVTYYLSKIIGKRKKEPALHLLPSMATRYASISKVSIF